MRLIDADELTKKAIIHFYTTNYFSHIMDMIDEAQTIEERPTAELIRINSLYKCSNCGELICCEANYCPDCGEKYNKT